MNRTETAITPPILGVEVALIEFDPLTDVGRAVLARFMDLTPEASEQSFRHVYAQYRDFDAAVG
ncbi:MAG: hypothetical protein WBA67_00485, partial [Jannaschia sp.]